MAVRMTEGSASTVAGRPPRFPPRMSSAGWLGAAATVSDRSRQRPTAWRSTQTDDHQRVLPIHPHGTLPPDPRIVEPVTAADQMPDNRLTVRAGPLGQLADRRPGPQDGLEPPRPVKTVYGTAKNTWAFPPTTPGNFTRTPGGSARSRHLSPGVALDVTVTDSWPL